MLSRLGPGARGDVSPRGRAHCLRSRLPYGRGGGEDIGGSLGYLGLRYRLRQ